MKANIKDLPLLIGKDPAMDKAIDAVIRSPEDPKAIAELSRHMKIQIKFSEPVWIKKGPRRNRNKTEHTFSNLFVGDKTGSLCYKSRSNAHYGYILDTYKAIEWKPLCKKGDDQFKGFEDFKKRFDSRFITEAEIQKLWNSRSSQHGKQYNRNDFRKLSKTGLQLMKRFLLNFKGVSNEGGPGYIPSQFGDYKVLCERYHSTGRQSSHFGRDLTISHQTNLEYVFYSSEYPGCGNGRYGLIANEKEYLWLEDD